MHVSYHETLFHAHLKIEEAIEQCNVVIDVNELLYQAEIDGSFSQLKIWSLHVRIDHGDISIEHKAPRIVLHLCLHECRDATVSTEEELHKMHNTL